MEGWKNKKGSKRYKVMMILDIVILVALFFILAL
jgi:hypothetical protein